MAAKYAPMIPTIFNRAKQLHSIWTNPRAKFQDKLGATFSLPSIEDDAVINYSGPEIKQLGYGGSERKIIEPQYNAASTTVSGGLTTNTGQLQDWELSLPTAINKKSIATALYPERDWNPQVNTTDPMARIAGGRVVKEYVINTGSTGNVGVYVFPLNALHASVTMTDVKERRWRWMMMYSGSNFDPATGVDTDVGVDNYPGPFYEPESFTTGFALNSMALEYIPRQNMLNVQGNILTTWWNEPPNVTFKNAATTAFGICNINRSSMLNMKNTRTQAAKDPFRYVHMFNDSGEYSTHWLEDGNDDTSNMKVGDYLLWEGCTTNTQIGILRLTFQIDYVPVLSLQTKVMVYDAPQGASNPALKKAILHNAPHLLNLSRVDAEKLSEQILNFPSNNIADIVQFIKGIKYSEKKFPNTLITTAHSEPGDNILSFDDSVV
jgi:hypothetical protein